MRNFDSRLSKLELFAREPGTARTKAERDAAFEAFLAKVRPVAAICISPGELAAHLKSLAPASEDNVVSLDLRQRREGMIERFSRRLWDEEHGNCRTDLGA